MGGATAKPHPGLRQTAIPSGKNRRRLAPRDSPRLRNTTVKSAAAVARWNKEIKTRSHKPQSRHRAESASSLRPLSCYEILRCPISRSIPWPGFKLKIIQSYYPSVCCSCFLWKLHSWGHLEAINYLSNATALWENQGRFSIAPFFGNHAEERHQLGRTIRSWFRLEDSTMEGGHWEWRNLNHSAPTWFCVVEDKTIWIIATRSQATLATICIFGCWREWAGCGLFRTSKLRSAPLVSNIRLSQRLMLPSPSCVGTCLLGYCWITTANFLTGGKLQTSEPECSGSSSWLSFTVDRTVPTTVAKQKASFGSSFHCSS